MFQNYYYYIVCMTFKEIVPDEGMPVARLYRLLNFIGVLRPNSVATCDAEIALFCIRNNGKSI